jgi:hypothetical protein
MGMNPPDDDPQNVEYDWPQRRKNSDAGGGNPRHSTRPRLGSFRSGLMS